MLRLGAKLRHFKITKESTAKVEYCYESFDNFERSECRCKFASLLAAAILGVLQVKIFPQ